MATQIIIDALENELGLVVYLCEEEQDLIEIIEDEDTSNADKAREICVFFDVNVSKFFQDIVNILGENGDEES